MSTNLGEVVVRDFVQNSWSCVEAVVKELAVFKEAQPKKKRLFHF